MILVEILVLGLVLALATGGSLARLSRASLRGETVLLLVLPLQLLWPRMAPMLGVACEISVIVWLLMMAILVAVLLVNVSPRRWMLAVAAAGIAANMAVIGVNEGMPVSMQAASEIGDSRNDTRRAISADCLYREMDAATRLGFFADVIAVPGPPWQRGVVSVGDLLLAAGLSGWIFISARRE